MRPETFSIVLEESSGPVSPRFQYTLRVRIHADAGGAVVVDAEESRSGNKTSITGATLAADAVSELWTALDANAVHTSGGDAVAEKKDRVGISFNWYELETSGASVRFDYLLSTLREPAYARQAAVVQAVKHAVDAVRAAK